MRITAVQELLATSILARCDASSDVRIVHNKLLGGWYVVRGTSDTPLSGKFASKEAAQQWLIDRKNARSDGPVREKDLQNFRDIHEAMQGGEPQNWQWVGKYMSQRMFGISEKRAKEYAAQHGGEAKRMDARGDDADNSARKAGDTLAYKGYAIKYNSTYEEFYISKGGSHIATAKSIEAAKKEIDGLV